VVEKNFIENTTKKNSIERMKYGTYRIIRKDGIKKFEETLEKLKGSSSTTSSLVEDHYFIGIETEEIDENGETIL